MSQVSGWRSLRPNVLHSLMAGAGKVVRSLNQVFRKLF